MSSVEIVSALERRVISAIPQQVISDEVAARIKNIGRTAKISGFRPGKVPEKVVEQQYGAQTYKEVLGEFLQNAFVEVVQLNNLRVMGPPKFEIKAAQKDADQIEYSATFEVYPDVVLGDLSDEVVERLTCELTQEDVANTIMTLRKQRITFEPAERAAVAGDKVSIDFSGKLDGQIFQGGDAKDHSFVLGSGQMLPEFESACIGMMANDTKSFDMTFPDNYPDKDMAGKQANFTITLHKVEAPILPEVDAKFAESVGIKDGDVSMLDSEVKTNLQREVVRRLKTRNKEAAMNVLLKASKFDVSGSLVQSEVRNLMKQAEQSIRTGMLSMEDSGALPELLLKNAERRVKLGLIISYLMQQHDLKAKPEQVRALVDDHAQSFDNPEDVVSWFYGDASQLQQAENLVLEENIVAWTLGQTKISDKAITVNELMGN